MSSTILGFNSIQNLGSNLNPATLAAYNTQLSGLTATQQRAALSMTTLNAKQKEEVLNYIAATAASKTLTQQQFLECSIDQKRAMLKAGLITEEELETGTTIALTQEKIKEIIADEALSVEDKKLILGAFGVTGANTTTTVSFGLLTKSIWANIKAMIAWMASNPIGWIIAIAAAIIGATVAITNYNKKLEENRQEMIEAGKQAAQLTKDLDGLIEQYRKLGEDGKLDNSDREQAYDIQQQINELLGDEVGYINLANGKYEDQLELLKKLQYQKANDKYADFKEAKDSAEESLRSKISNVGVGNNIAKSEMEAIEELSKLPGMDKYLKTYEGDNRGRGKFAMFNVDTSSTEALVTSYEKMVELRNILSKSYTDEIKKGGSLEDFYNNLKEEIGELSDAVTKYKEAMSDYNINQAVITFNETEFDVEGLGKIKGAFIDSEKAMTGWITSMMGSKDVSDGVQAELIVLAQTWYPQYVKQINEAVEAQAKKVAQDALVDKSLDENIQGLKNEASALGITEGAMIELVLAEIRFNKNNLDVSQKISALKELAVWAGVAEKKIDSIIGVNAKSSGDEKKVWAERNNFEVIGTDKEGERWTYNGEEYYSWAYRDKTTGKIYDDIDSANTVLLDRAIQEEIDKFREDGGGAGGGGGGSDSTTADKNSALDNYLKDAENRYKIHQDETKYIEDLNYALNNLVKTEDERLDVVGKINEAYRDLADNRIKDLEHQIDLKKELYGENYNATSEWSEIQRIAHEEANRLRAMGYDNNSSEIQDLQKTWWDAENEKLDWRFNHSKDWIDERSDKNDWALFNDNEVRAWERVVAWLKSDYPNAVDEIKEAEKNLYEARKEYFEDASDFGSSIFDSRKTVLESVYEVTNSIADAQHELNKELEISKSKYEYLDEETRKLLFNESDYTALSNRLLSIQEKSYELQQQYEYDLSNATADTLDDITDKYERQYETLMKSYEIAKADLEIAKKKAQLNNVLAERNVRQLVERDGKFTWEWVADSEAVANAKAELADAEYDKRTKQNELQQQNTLNSITAQQEAFNAIITNFNEGLLDLDTAVDLAAKALGTLPDAIDRAFALASPSYSVNSKYSNSFVGTSVPATTPDGRPINVKIVDGKTMTPGLQPGTIIHSQGGDYEITGGTAGNYISRKITAYASGSKSTTRGLAIMGENGDETYINNNGHYIPINQPTIGGIGTGGVVFNSEQMTNLRSLWDLSNMNLSSRFAGQVADHMGGGKNITIGDIHVHNPHDYNGFVQELTKRIKERSL